VTRTGAEIIELNAYRKRRTAAVPVSAGPASLHGQMSAAPLVMAISWVFWPTWVFGPFVVAAQRDDGLGAT
jgi:hypothetical protein